LHYLALLNSGCPVGRHELRNEEWIALGAMKVELERIAAEDAKEGAEANAGER
jgi:hypothetical protein